jgi:hypothetical protein
MEQEIRRSGGTPKTESPDLLASCERRVDGTRDQEVRRDTQKQNLLISRPRIREPSGKNVIATAVNSRECSTTVRTFARYSVCLNRRCATACSLSRSVDPLVSHHVRRSPSYAHRYAGRRDRDESVLAHRARRLVTARRADRTPRPRHRRRRAPTSDAALTSRVSRQTARIAYA